MTRDQEDQRRLHEINKCKGCFFADEKALKNLTRACTYPGKLEFNTVGCCITRRQK